MPEDITPPPPPRRPRPEVSLTWDMIVGTTPRSPFTEFTAVSDRLRDAFRVLERVDLPVGFTFEGRENVELLTNLPVGTVIRGGVDEITRTHQSSGYWLGENGVDYYSHSMGGPYEIISYPEGVEAPEPEPPVSLPRPRYTNGRFVSREDAQRFRIGDTVRTARRPAQRADGTGYVPANFANADVVLVNRRRVRDGLWTVKRADGTNPYDTTPIHESSFTLLKRDLSITEPEVFERGDRVQVNGSPRITREDGDFYESGFRNRYCEVIDVDVYGDGEVYNVRREDSPRRTATIWGGSMTLIERNGVVTEAGRSAPPRPILCANDYCGRVMSEDEERISVYYPAGRTGCRACTQRCRTCNNTHIPEYGYIHDINGRNYCNDCCSSCDDCGTHFIDDGDGCPDWEDHEMPRGVHGYGHTSASMLLGGPVPKTEDGKIDTAAPGAYYVGIELEISASYEQSAMPIYDWAEEHLGHRDAIVCKEDSSVRGFEIVTQPMTPQLFESVDWESFMDLLNQNHPLPSGRDDEPTEHGLHVHIGRIAFGRDDVAQAAYSYLLSQGDHLERIGRRAAYHYCAKVRYPVSAHISRMAYNKTTPQTLKVQRRGIGAGRDAVNLQNEQTIEVRAFRSTRSADYLRNAVRLTYIAAEYIRYLRVNKEAVSPKSLHWDKFAAWVGEHYPEAHPSIAGIESEGSNKRVLVGASTTPVVNFDQ